MGRLERSPRRRTLSPRVALLALVIGSVACQLPPSGPSRTATANAAADLDLCAAEINHYRVMGGRPPVSRSEALERFAAEAAQHDARAGVPHLLFSRTNGGGGVARAETQLLRWTGYEVAEVLRRGLADMWAAGPGGSHYDVMLGDFSEVGCGVFVSGRQVSISQDYR